MNRQDSLTDQLRSLIPVANFHGMYDAADFLKATIASADREGVIHERPPMGGRRVDFIPEPPLPLYIKDPSGAKVMVPNPEHPSPDPRSPYCHE